MTLRLRALTSVLAALALCACAAPRGPAAPAPAVTPPPAAPTTTAPVPPPRPAPAAARSCVPRGLGPAPRYPDSDTALRNAAGAADRYQLMAAGRLMRQRRLEELERVVAGCR